VWITSHPKARIVGITLGHDQRVHDHEAFRTLLVNAVILRVALNCDCVYEWGHHVHLGGRAGLTAEEIERVRSGPDDDGWSPRRGAMLRAVDELHESRDVTDATWSELRDHFDDKDLVELCLLVGHYEMLAMTINSLGIQPDRH